MTASAVERELKKLESKSGKLQALKENICIRVIGLGWSDLSTTCSKDGEVFSPKRLSQHLKTIISEPKKRVIPSAPPVELPKRKNLPHLGEQSHDLKEIDRCYQQHTSGFYSKAKKIHTHREMDGIGDRISEMQPLSMLI